ncbi:MAG: hypothetical protein FJ022_07200 [Chloroflexi bacterium]|nr:hypothetical protein [Chloroflexota bacterium]MBM4450561.1 hypothetical protein [Chloroflexota bacterium]
MRDSAEAMAIREKFENFRRLYTDRDSIESTVNRLLDDKLIPPERADLLKRNLPDTIRQSRYILLNLGAHMAIGAIFSFDIVPLPLGTISRVLWVAGNRIYSEVKRDDEKKKVHSVTVLIVSAIPWIGYFAYTLPLKKVNEDAAYLYANHITYERKKESLVKYIQGKPAIIRRILERLLIPDDIRKYLELGGYESDKE